MQGEVMADSELEVPKLEDDEDGSIPKVLREGDHSTDIIFLVEERSLYFMKAFLTVCSPVFHTLLTPEYIQQHSEGIPLPGKTYRDVAFFLQLIHPVYSVTPLTDDRLLATLALAKEYQVDHINTKCEQYIGIQLQLHEHTKMLTVDALLLYLTACDQHQLAKHRGTLVTLVSEETTHDLQASRLFGIVPPTALKDGFLARDQILERNIQILEGRNSQLKSGLNNIRTIIVQTKSHMPANEYAKGLLDGVINSIDAMQLKCFT